MTEHRHDHSVQTVKDINTEDREKSSEGHESSTEKNKESTLKNFGGEIRINLVVACDALGCGMFLLKQHPLTSHLAWILKMCKDKTLESLQERPIALRRADGESEWNERNGKRKISLNKDIILLPKEGMEPVLLLKTGEEEA